MVINGTSIAGTLGSSIKIYDLQATGDIATKSTFTTTLGFAVDQSVLAKADFCEETRVIAGYFTDRSQPTPETGSVVIFKLNEENNPVLVQKVRSNVISPYSKSFGLNGVCLSDSGKTMTVTSVQYKHLNDANGKKTSLVDVFYINASGLYEWKYSVIPDTITGSGGDGTAIYADYGSVLSGDSSIHIAKYDGSTLAGTIYSGSILISGLVGDKLKINPNGSQSFIQNPSGIGQSGMRFGYAVALDTEKSMIYIGAPGLNDGKTASGAIWQYKFMRVK